MKLRYREMSQIEQKGNDKRKDYSKAIIFVVIVSYNSFLCDFIYKVQLAKKKKKHFNLKSFFFTF